MIATLAAAAFLCASPGVVDGDTLRCHGGTRVRIWGIQAPERHHAEGRETWLAAGATAIHAHQIGVTLIAEKGRVITVKPQTKRGVQP